MGWDAIRCLKKLFFSMFDSPFFSQINYNKVWFLFPVSKIILLNLNLIYRPHVWQNYCWMYSLLKQDAWLLMCLHACRQPWQHLQSPNSTSVFLPNWWQVLEEKKDEVLDYFSTKKQNNRPLKLATKKPNHSIHIVHTRVSFISSQEGINGCEKSS